MSLDDFRALGLPEESSLYLLAGVVCSDEPPEGTDMTKRGWRHAFTEARVAAKLNAWVDESGLPLGVFSGEVGCDISADSSVGIDAAVFSLDQLKDEEPYVEGVPLLAVEILSPSDQHGNVNRKIRNYLQLGVRQVWVIDPELQTVVTHASDQEPSLFTRGDRLSGGDNFPGLSIDVAGLFPLRGG